MTLVNYLRKPLPYRNANVLLYIIGVNIVIFFFTSASPSIGYFMGMQPIDVIEGNQWWRLVTYMFVHANFTHLLLNMLGLYFFGMRVEQTIGNNEFLLFYFVCGIGAGLFSLAGYLLSGNINVNLVGASGAVYAVLLAFATYFPYARIYLFAIFPVPAPLLIIALTVISVLSPLTLRGGNIAHFTHLVGFIIAFFYLWIRLERNPINALFKS